MPTFQIVQPGGMPTANGPVFDRAEAVFDVGDRVLEFGTVVVEIEGGEVVARRTLDDFAGHHGELLYGITPIKWDEVDSSELEEVPQRFARHPIWYLVTHRDWKSDDSEVEWDTGAGDAWVEGSADE